MKNKKNYFKSEIEIIYLENKDEILTNSPRFGEDYSENDYLITGIDFWGINL